MGIPSSKELNPVNPQEDPKEYEFDQHLKKIIACMDNLNASANAFPDDILGLSIRCMDSMQGSTKHMFQKLNRMYSECMPPERQQKMDELSREFWHVLLTTLDFTPLARQTVREQKVAAELLKCVNKRLQSIDDLDQVPGEVVRMSQLAAQKLLDCQTKYSARALEPKAKQLSQMYAKLAAKISEEISEVQEIAKKQKDKKEQYEYYGWIAFGCFIAAGILCVVALCGFVSAFIATHQAAGAAAAASAKLAQAKTAAQAAQGFWAWISGQTAAAQSALAAAQATQAAAAGGAATATAAAIGTGAATGVCGLAAYAARLKLDEHEEMVSTLFQTLHAAELLQCRYENLKDGMEKCNVAASIIQNYLRNSSGEMKDMIDRLPYWDMLKSPGAGSTIERMIDNLEGVLSNTDLLENQTRQNLAGWMKTPDGQAAQVNVVQTTLKVTMPLLEALVEDANAQEGTDAVEEWGFEPQAASSVLPVGARLHGANISSTPHADTAFWVRQFQQLQ